MLGLRTLWRKRRMRELGAWAAEEVLVSVQVIKITHAHRDMLDR